jgi:hypothetical protein
MAQFDGSEIEAGIYQLSTELLVQAVTRYLKTLGLVFLGATPTRVGVQCMTCGRKWGIGRQANGLFSSHAFKCPKGCNAALLPTTPVEWW